jgi:hypothetical protein
MMGQTKSTRMLNLLQFNETPKHELRNVTLVWLRHLHPQKHFIGQTN